MGISYPELKSDTIVRAMAERTSDPRLLNSLIKIAENRALTVAELAAINKNLDGFDKTLGLHFRHIEQGQVISEILVADIHLQPYGLVNGGVFSAIAESTGSLAGLIAAEGRQVVGINNSTDFIRSVRSGMLIAEATPIQLGRKTQLWQVETKNNGKVSSRTTLRTMILSN